MNAELGLRAGILDAIKHKRQRALDTMKKESSLEALVQEAPTPPPVRRLLYADATPEALAHALAIDRRTRPSFVLCGRRLTFGLMAQPDALRNCLERAGTLPRGTGFIARFLIAWPQST